MRTTAVARRYAAALCDLAKERGLLDEVEAELRLIATTMEQDERVRNLVSHQGLEPGEKRRLLLELFGDRLSDLTRKFLSLLLEKRREALLIDMYRAYVACADQVRNLIEVEVRTAVPLEQTELESVVSTVSRVLGKAVRPKVVQDPGLIGGLAVRVGDVVFDGTIATRLRRLGERLKATRIQSVG